MESEHRQASEDSLTSATESDLVAKVNKLSSVLLVRTDGVCAYLLRIDSNGANRKLQYSYRGV